jgi:hypothetical protein
MQKETTRRRIGSEKDDGFLHRRERQNLPQRQKLPFHFLPHCFVAA